jgi:hypothetical protein
MERTGDQEQKAADVVEDYPGNQQTAAGSSDTTDNGQPTFGFGFGRDEFGQTTGAQDPAFVFGNAFPAKKSPAFRAPGHGFAVGMVETALSDQVCQLTPVVGVCGAIPAGEGASRPYSDW